jgi:hypothetical protein
MSSRQFIDSIKLAVAGALTRPAKMQKATHIDCKVHATLLSL